MRENYVTLILCLWFRFPDSWFGDRLPIAPSFHLNARDVVMDCLDTSHHTTAAGAVDGIDAERMGTAAGADAKRIDTAAESGAGVASSAESMNAEKMIELSLETTAAAAAAVAPLHGSVADVPQSVLHFYTSQIMLHTSVETAMPAGAQNHAAECEKQLQCGVLMRLERVQRILELISTELLTKEGTFPLEEMKARAAEIVETSPYNLEYRGTPSSAVPTIGKKNEKKAVVVVKTDDSVSEMDKLRLISQVAFKFLS